MLHTPLRAIVALALAGLTFASAAPARAGAVPSPTLAGGVARVNSEAALELIVPPDPRRPTIKVRLAIPAGLAVVRCSAGADWRCRQVPQDGVGPAVIEWVRTAGNGSAERFSFALQTPAQPGRYPLAVTRTSAPSVTVRFDGKRGAVGPAPVLEVLAKLAAGPTPTTVDEPNDSGRGAIVSGGVAVIVAGLATALAVAWWRRRRR